MTRSPGPHTPRRPHRPLAALAALLLLPLAACDRQTPPPAAPSPDAAGEAAAVPERLPAAAFVARVRPGDVVLDVRTPAEFAAGHLAGALNVDVAAPDFEARVAALDRDRTTYAYCRSGGRSARAVAAMRAMGFTRVFNVGGYDDLVAAGAPAVGGGG
jgi:rhodanese-related sulfurtransferase